MTQLKNVNPNWEGPAFDAGEGDVYYVNGGSDGPTDDNGDGSRVAPKQTIQAAIDLCISGNDDYVLILNYGSNGRAAETWPVEVNKDQVHIIGLRATAGSKWSVTTSGDSDTNAFTVTGQRCEFANLEIGGDGTGSGIEIGNGFWGTTIHDCLFGVTVGVGENGITVASGADAPYLTIYDNIFGARLTQHGIEIIGSATRGQFGLPGHGNKFNQIVGIAINITGSAVGIDINDNLFSMAAQTAGDAITLAAGSSSCNIHNNHAFYGKSTDTTKYWVSPGSSNHFGWNTVNGVLLQP